MSLLEMIARRSTTESTAFSLPDVLAEEALSRLLAEAPGDAALDNARLNLIIAEFFARELLKDDIDSAMRYTELLFHYGISERRFLSQVLPAAADALGRAWEEDQLTFIDVTHATGQLLEVARSALSPPPVAVLYRPDRPRALLLRTPGEDHSIGLILTAQDLRHRGWLVKLDLSGDPAALAAACALHRFDVVGFTIAGAGVLAGLRDCIGRTRDVAEDALVVAGGWLVETDPGISAEAGADLGIGRGALAMEQLLRRVSGEGG